MSDNPRTPDDVSGAPTTISAHGLEGILAVVPYLLGFHPDDSLVAVLFCERRVGLTLRLDITHLVDNRTGVAEMIDTQMRRLDADQVLLIAYTHQADADMACDVADLGLALDVEALARGEQPRVLDVVHVAGGRYRSLTDPGSCPDQWRDYRAVLDDPAAAEAVLNGLPARASRDDLRTLVTPGTEPGDDSYRAAVADAAHRVAGLPPFEAAQAMDQLLRDLEGTHRVPEPQGLAEVTGMVMNAAARDVATLRIQKSTADRWSTIWAAAVRRTDGMAAVAPLGLVGMAAWARGDGALVSLCVEEAEKRCPDHGLVRLLTDVVTLGLHPDTWARMRDQTLAEYGPLGPAAHTH